MKLKHSRNSGKSTHLMDHINSNYPLELNKHKYVFAYWGGDNRSMLAAAHLGQIMMSAKCKDLQENI